MNNNPQTAIDKLRALCNWMNYQDENLGQQFTEISQLESLFNYAKNNDIEFMDDECLYMACTQDEREAAKRFISELLKSNK